MSAWARDGGGGRLVRWVWAVVVGGCCVFAPTPVAAQSLACAEQASVLVCDADGDGIVDVVEEAICGSATCATGAEDADGDGVPDAQQLAQSLATGGPGGPVQLSSPSTVIVVGADGSVTEFSLVPFAAVAGVLLVGLGAVVAVRRRSVGGRARHRVGELVR